VLDVSIGIAAASGQNVAAPLLSWVTSVHPHRVWVQQNGLSGSYVSCQQAVAKTYGLTTFGFQMAGSTNQPGVGSLGSAIDVALRDGAAYLEVYSEDVERKNANGTYTYASQLNHLMYGAEGRC